ncbi:MAG: hypothetical protein IPJ01_10095 [Micavibrio sp.]|nr:hypothetical protein [Micavibrio sp.]
MKKITKYEAIDGKVFNTEKECLEYEKIIEKVDVIMKPFDKRPKGTNFTNGGGYLQHDTNEVNKAKKQITELGNDIFKCNADFGFIGRYFDDSGYDCLYSAWGRLSNTDSKGREWGQGYFAVNPEKGKQIQLN